MDPQKSETNELISGLLDGHLSIEESRKLADESAKNPQIERDTETLASLRSSLLRGRPTGKLGDHFAVRVMEAAKARAAILGEDAPEWIDASNSSMLPKPFDPSELKSRWWVPAMSVLATCVLAFLFTKLTLLYNESLDREQRELIADFERKQNEQELLSVFGKSPEQDTSAPDGNSAESSIVTNMLAESKKRLESTEAAKETEAVAAIENGQVAEAAVPTIADKDMSNSLENAIASNSTGPESGTSGTSNAISETSREIENRPMSEADKSAETGLVSNNTNSGKLQYPPLKATAKMMVVYEVVIDQAAQTDNVLGIYLEKHGLGSIEDLVLEEAELASVLNSGIVGPADARGDAQVLVLKGSARMLSDFYDDLAKSYEDFPALRMNAVMDDSVGVIERQMTTMQVSDTKGAVGRLGASGPSGLVSSFSAGSSKFFEVPMEQRRLDKRREPGQDLNPISYVILIVRSAK